MEVAVDLSWCGVLLLLLMILGQGEGRGMAIG